jgi:hypothetical protein
LIRHLYRKVINKIPLPLVRIRNYPSPELIGRVAPTRTEGINLRGVFRFPVERYAEKILPSAAAQKTTARSFMKTSKTRRYF